jgi:hypothetical protein
VIEFSDLCTSRPGHAAGAKGPALDCIIWSVVASMHCLITGAATLLPPMLVLTCHNPGLRAQLGCVRRHHDQQNRNQRHPNQSHEILPWTHCSMRTLPDRELAYQLNTNTANIFELRGSLPWTRRQGLVNRRLQMMIASIPSCKSKPSSMGCRRPEIDVERLSVLKIARVERTTKLWLCLARSALQVQYRFRL